LYLKKVKTPGAFVLTGRWMFVDGYVYFSLCLYQASFDLIALSFFARRDFFLAAVPLCMVLVAAALSSFLVTCRNCSDAASTLPTLRASSNRFVCVFIWLFLDRFMVLFLLFCLILFLDDNELATIVS